MSTFARRGCAFAMTFCDVVSRVPVSSTISTTGAEAAASSRPMARATAATGMAEAFGSPSVPSNSPSSVL